MLLRVLIKTYNNNRKFIIFIFIVRYAGYYIMLVDGIFTDSITNIIGSPSAYPNGVYFLDIIIMRDLKLSP